MSGLGGFEPCQPPKKAVRGLWAPIATAFLDGDYACVSKDFGDADKAARAYKGLSQAAHKRGGMSVILQGTTVYLVKKPKVAP